MSPRTATTRNTPVDDAEDRPSAESPADAVAPTDETNIVADRTTVVPAFEPSGGMTIEQLPKVEAQQASCDGRTDACVVGTGDPLDAATDASDSETGSRVPSDATNDHGTADSHNSAMARLDQVHSDGAETASDTAETEQSSPDGQTYPLQPEDGDGQSPDETRDSAPLLPDPTSISERLRNLVVSVSHVEELSRRARDAATNDLALYSGIAASQRQFEDGLAEARRIGQEAAAVYQRAFGREARALAEPAVVEAHEVEDAFSELVDAWRGQAQVFLADHPDVEALLSDREQQESETRRREAARAKAQRFQQLVSATDDALRHGLLEDARECLKMLDREFPGESSRLAPLRERLEHRVRAANDAGARRVMLQASELQGRGEFDAAVSLLEAIDVDGLSRETSEDVFGRWSAACSLAAQIVGLVLERSSVGQGHGVMLHQDPAAPYGRLVFSALGMGPTYVKGRVVSATDKEGAALIGRARGFRAAKLPAELSAEWYGHSYVSSETSSAAPIHH